VGFSESAKGGRIVDTSAIPDVRYQRFLMQSRRQ
jgi:hypothetical protein